MHVLVLGAGVVGTATAWFLARAGHAVTVIERQPAAGLETSYANGGQVSVSHAEPWANPAAPLKILRWLAQPDAPLRFRLRPEPAQWAWSLAFLRECLPGRTRDNIVQIVNLGLYSRATLAGLRAETGIAYDQRTRGILHFYTDPREFEAAIAPAELMRRYGCDRQVKSADECVAIEPALAGFRERLAGGTYTADDESGDARLFTQRLAALCTERGVDFRYGHRVLRIEHDDGRFRSLRVADDEGRIASLAADACVVAAGSHSPQLVRPLGLRLPIYPAKGYSATFDLADPARAPTVSLTDDAHKLVYSRLGERLRVAGSAELAGYDTRLDETRCRALVRRTTSLFPGVVDAEGAKFWTGLRPATPSNVPLIGRTRITGLFLNTGHGTLGWTQACGSGRALADIVGGHRPEVDFRFVGMEAR